MEGLEALARLTASCHNARAQWQNDPTGVNIETVSGQRRTQRHNAKRRLSDDHSRCLIDDQSRPNNEYNDKTGSRTEVKKRRKYSDSAYCNYSDILGEVFKYSDILRGVTYMEWTRQHENVILASFIPSTHHLATSTQPRLCSGFWWSSTS